MYGYEPPKQDEQGSWKEVLAFVWVAMTVIVPIFGVVLLVGALFASIFILGAVARPLALIPISILIGAVVYLGVREKRNTDAAEERITGNRPGRR